MKKCPICGQKYEVSENFCANEGATLIVGEVFSKAPQPPVPVIPPQNLISSGNDSAKWLYLITGVLSTLIFSILIGFYWSNNSVVIQSENSANSTNATENQNKVIVQSNLAAENKQTFLPPIPNQSGSSSNLPIRTASFDSKQINTEIREKIYNWKNQAESHDLDAYMDCYAERIDYYRKKGATKSFVRSDKQRAFSKFSSIQIGIEIIDVTTDTSGENANALIDKEWTFEGESYTNGKVRQEIRFSKVAGDWVITGERDLKVFYVNK